MASNLAKLSISSICSTEFTSAAAAFKRVFSINSGICMKTCPVQGEHQGDDAQVSLDRIGPGIRSRDEAEAAGSAGQ